MTHDRHDTFVPLLTLEPLTKLQGSLQVICQSGQGCQEDAEV